MTNVQSPNSMWQTVSSASAYDINAIYVNSTDGNGHYERVRVKVTPPILAELAEMVASKVQPGYRTVEDFVRDAIVHRLWFLSNTTWPQATNIITAEMIETRINRGKAKIESWASRIKETQEYGDDLLVNGALFELGEFLTSMDQDFENMDLPIVKRKEMQDTLDTLHDRMKRARIRDY